MSKLFIPLSLERVRPSFYKLALMCETQEQIDRIVELATKPFLTKKEHEQFNKTARKAIGVKGDFQAASQYSLDACQGGFNALVSRRIEKGDRREK